MSKLFVERKNLDFVFLCDLVVNLDRLILLFDYTIFPNVYMYLFGTSEFSVMCLDFHSVRGKEMGRSTVKMV